MTQRNSSTSLPGPYRAAGLEKVLADKSDWLVRHGYDVVIATTDQRGQEPAFPMNPAIRMVDLGINYEATNGANFLKKALLFPVKKWKHRRRLKKLLIQEKPDITVSMFCNDAGFLPKIQDGSKKVLEVHFSRFKRLQYGRKGIWAMNETIHNPDGIRRMGVAAYEKSLRWDSETIMQQWDRVFKGIV